jgi:FkbM family methyltransferase
MTPFRRAVSAALPLAVLALAALAAPGQEKSVRPGINDAFKDPDLKGFLKKFEVESREVYTNRDRIVAACKVRPGMAVADVGAGTGLFTRLFAKAVGPRGKVYAVDIAPAFLRHIEKTCQEEGIKNVVRVQCTQTSTELPAGSVDLAFVCDTYHHFEFPFRTLSSLHRALRPKGRVVLIDFHRVEGVSSKWVLGHVRAGQEVFKREVLSSGFRLVGEEKFLKENYLLVFEKAHAP